MTDKVQKIREEIENKLEVMQYQVHRKDAYKELKGVLAYIDSLQEESNDVVDKYLYDKEPELVDEDDLPKEESISEDLEEASKNYALNNTPWDDCKDEIQESFRAGAKWQKQQDQSTIELAEDHAMLAGMEKMKEQMTKDIWKPADGDDLPEIDREVIVLCKNGRVAFGHRPVEKFIARPIGYGRTEEYEVKTYDKGGWNIPDIVYWLDVKLPKEIEL